MTPPLPLEEAQARLLALAQPLPIERDDVAGALGRYLAEPLVARRTQPAADLSAMDGYAVAAEDMAGPWRIIGESAAGHPCERPIGRGYAARIATGALLPDGAGAVILQEDCVRRGDTLELTGSPPSPPGKHIRRRGMDFIEGVELLPAGARVGPAQIGLALAAGHTHLAVRPAPRLAILDSGDELATDPERCAAHQIPASNGAMLTALAKSVPCVVTRLGPIRDDSAELALALRQAEDADVVVTIGGASVGDHDLIRPAVEAWGADLDFWRIAIKPGKPLLVARRGRQVIVGLPGNPISSHVTGFLFLLPLLRALLGAGECLPRVVAATLASPVGHAGKRREFLRGHWDGRRVTAHPVQDSAALSALAASNALIDRPAGAPAQDAGSDVPIYLLENGGVA